LIAGRKLLVADDSPAYRKLLDLTFTDEGMEVTTVGGAREAWEKLEQSPPDLVLADVFMPEISGYELCERIKQNERFGRIPVILLVGLHEPFDEAEARRVGADDVVTKPFESIRQLVGRVGSLLGGTTGAEESGAHEYSTLGLEHSDPTPSAAPDDQAMPEENVTVFVEAASMTETDVTDSNEPAGSTCAADIELQTADTMQLERIDDEPPVTTVEAIAYAQDDTAEMPRVTKANEREDSSAERFLEEALEEPAAIDAPEMSEQSSQQVTPAHGSAVFDDALLDLGDFDSRTQRAIAEDVILDLDYEEPVGEPLGEPLSQQGAKVSEPVAESAAVFEPAAPAQVIAPRFAPEDAPVAVAEFQEWAIVTPLETTEAPVEVTEATVEEVARHRLVEAVVEVEQTGGDANLSLSPETIDAIARRTVEHLSEKVVREIAWEVVPELAELLIKKKLEEEK
jgi:CheY-like chemotaxis protein